MSVESWKKGLRSRRLFNPDELERRSMGRLLELVKLEDKIDRLFSENEALKKENKALKESGQDLLQKFI